LAYTAEFLWITTRGGELGSRNWVISDYGMRAESAPNHHTLFPRDLNVLADRIST